MPVCVCVCVCHHCITVFPLQVGDEIVEINGEPARGISHTRAIELIQAGGSKVVLLLRPGAGLAQDSSKLLPAKHSHNFTNPPDSGLAQLYC